MNNTRNEAPSGAAAGRALKLSTLGLYAVSIMVACSSDPSAPTYSPPRRRWRGDGLARLTLRVRPAVTAGAPSFGGGGDTGTAGAAPTAGAPSAGAGGDMTAGAGGAPVVVQPAYV